MSKNEILIILAVSLIIFSLGFFLRLESIHLSGITENEKAFYQYDNNLPYMYDMDSYYNYRLTVNYLKHGYLGDTIINGKEWDLHSYYPPGVPMDYPPLIVYLTAFLYNIINLFTNIPLMIVCFWLAALISPLAGILAYFVVRKFTNDYGAATAGILTVTAPFYFMRTVPGWFDTDMFNILFPFLIILFFFEALETKNQKMMIVFSLLSAFSMFLFAFAWNGWQYFFYIIVLFTIFYSLWNLIKGNNVKNYMHILGIFLIVSLSLICILTGFLNVLKVFMGPQELLNIFQTHGLWYPWPNVYNLISELQTPSLGSIFSGIGPTLFGLGLFGILASGLILKRKDKDKKYLKKFNWFIYLFLIIWIITSFLALIKGIRFILLIIPPLAIFAGISVGICVDFIKVNQELKTIFSVVLVIIISISSVVVINDNYSSLNPRMNDDLWNAGEWIHNNTSNNTVVISNWVYGHFFAAIADRPTTFDGRLAYIETVPIRNYDSAFSFTDKSPGTAREYWIDKAFTTSNESLSLGIFRMISTSGDLAYLNLDKHTNNTAKTVEILNNILGADKNTARHLLLSEYNLSENEANDILKYTHPDNPHPFVLITDDSLVNKAPWIFYFGSWDFNNLNGTNYQYSSGDIMETSSFIKTNDGILMDLKSGNLTWNNKTPYSTTLISNGTYKKLYLDNNSNFTVVLNLDSKKSFIISKELENSLFMKLVAERHYTTYFKSIYSNNSVIVWKIYN